jgi:hypothetical protein
MSQENVEVVKGFLSRFEGGDRHEWREHFDPNVVWDASASQLPAADVYHGHEGVERFFRDWLGTWTDWFRYRTSREPSKTLQLEAAPRYGRVPPLRPVHFSRRLLHRRGCPRRHAP